MTQPAPGLVQSFPSEQLEGIYVYVGDIHGTRLSGLDHAFAALGVEVRGLLCTMDVDQVLALRDLAQMETRFREEGKRTVLVAGNHEAAIIYRIGIDSSTYRASRQETNIRQLIEQIHLPPFGYLRQFVERKLAIRGGWPLSLGGTREASGLLIHGALDGKREKYLHEFPADLQEHVLSRGDLWLRCETREHLLSNFAAMDERGARVMIRGHDHYVAMRSLDEDGKLFAHQVVSHEVGADGVAQHTTAPVRDEDQPDDIVTADPGLLARAAQGGGIYWNKLVPEKRYVINFGPYYRGHFGLVRSGDSERPPAVAFFRTKTSYYGAADRKRELKPYSPLQQARAGKTFYELFKKG